MVCACRSVSRSVERRATTCCLRFESAEQQHPDLRCASRPQRFRYALVAAIVILVLTALLMVALPFVPLRHAQVRSFAFMSLRRLDFLRAADCGSCFRVFSVGLRLVRGPLLPGVHCMPSGCHGVALARAVRC